MNRFAALACFPLALVCMMSLSSCMLLLTNEHLSHGYYVSPSETFRCKLPGGALSRQLHIRDQRNAVGETVTFKLGPHLLWRVDHLHLSQIKLKDMDKVRDRRAQLEKGKEHYFKYYLLPNLGSAEIRWERYEQTDDTEVLIAHTHLESDGMAGVRELLFSVDGDYLNVVHHVQGISGNLENIIQGSFGLYKNCEFR